MVSRRFACLFLAVSMTLSSIWIVSADQSHQIQDAAEAAASYSAAVQALEEAGLSQSAQANSNIAIDLGMLEQEETVDLSRLAVQAVQLQQEEEARQAEAARQANREAARRTGRQAARQALLDAYDGAMAARQITVYAAPSDSAASLRTLRQGKVARLNDVTEDGSWYQITFSGTTGYVRSDACQAVQYSDYAGTSAVKSAREDLVDYAKSFLGTRYVWGGASPSGFDCSGFTMYVYAHFGYRMSHGASDQLYAFTRVSTADAAGRGPGVLLLWRRRHLPCGHLSGRRGLHPRHLQRRGQDQLFRWLLQQHLCGCGADPGRLTTLYSLIPPLLLRAAVRRCAENYFFCWVSPNPFAVFSHLCTIERQNRLFWR